MSKILITGATGLLGRTIILENLKLPVAQRFDIIGGYFPQKNFETLKYLEKKYFLDIRDYNNLKKIIIEENIDTIIHCASLANVDYVERNREEAYQTNFLATKNIIDICKIYKIKLVHISTNAVYDGDNPPYSETAAHNPKNYYGQLKVMEENYASQNLENLVIIRPILMYGWNDTLERENPFTWQLRLQKENKEILLVDDIYCNPLLVNDCSKIIIMLLQKNMRGVFNIAGNEILSRYEFGVKIAKLTNYDIKKIKPVANAFFKEIAPRPKDTSFDITKLKTVLNYTPLDITTGIKFLLTQIQE